MLAFKDLLWFCWIEEDAGKSALADAGANGGEETEERVGTEDVEVAIVEMFRRVELVAGVSGLRTGSVCASEIGVVKDLQALNANELSLEAKVSGQRCDKGDERNCGQPCSASGSLQPEEENERRTDQEKDAMADAALDDDALFKFKRREALAVVRLKRCII